MEGGGGARSVHGGSERRLGPYGARGGAHSKHVVHVRDAGRVEAQRLVERRGVLPSHTKAHGGRHARRGAGGRGGGGGARSVHRGSWGHGTRGGHTLNIQYMLVTPDVSQLEMSSLKVFKPENRVPMSVIDETTQTEGGPYVLRAVAWSLTHIWTAVSREAWVANGYGQ